MVWQNIRGHDRIVEKFRRAIGKGRLASTFLFVGPAGIGKRTFALALAKALLCERAPEQRLGPCGQCPSCLQVASLNHPDVELIAKPADKAFIPLELLIGDTEHRMRAGLCYNIVAQALLRPPQNRHSRRRRLSQQGRRQLPPENPRRAARQVDSDSAIGTSEQRQLPTIRSRARSSASRRLTKVDVADY